MPLRNCCILSFLWTSIRAMGCLLGCFRTRDNNNHRGPRAPHRLVSISIQSNSNKGGPVPKNQLPSMIVQEEDGEALVAKDRENLVRRSGWTESDNDDRELKDEAKFLKACGALPETPLEIRKISKKLKDTPPHDANSDPSKFHSWLPNTSIGELLDENWQCDKFPDSTKIQEELGNLQGPMQDSSPSSYVINEESEISISITSPRSMDVGDAETALNLLADGTSESSISSLTPADSVVKGQTHKSVRFAIEIDSSENSPETTAENMEKSEFSSNQSVQNPSPCPTPLKFTDDMQTPGTVFATNLGNLDNGKKGRIRSQYVYKVPEHFNRGLKQDGVIMPLASVNEAQGHGQLGGCTADSEIHYGENLASEELKTDLRVSSWCKQPSSHGNEHSGAAHLGKAIAGRNLSDRPILGMVAAHWKEEEEVPRISPKGGYGNGIPNSTTKYKEDQKVRWHATPFEERLEKALSEEDGIICQRKSMSGTPIVFEEHESDVAAAPQFQSLSCPKSVISF